MQTKPHDEIPGAAECGINRDNIGQICLMNLGAGVPLAIGDTLEECIDMAEQCTGERISPDEIDTFTHLSFLTTENLVAVEIGPAEGE